MEHFPAYSSPDITNEGSTTSTPLTEERNHAIAYAQQQLKLQWLRLKQLLEL
jgi:hypothetical protein